MQNLFRLVSRLLLTVIILLLLFLPFYVAYLFGIIRLSIWLTHIGFWIGSKIWGLKLKKVGGIANTAPLMVVSNHFSYLDVFALGSFLKLRFTPKKEIADWPVIGFFCKMTGCVFIDRRRSQTAGSTKLLDKIMKEGGVISLFPEGTTNEGLALLPFKSSFFAIAEHADVTIQPVTILYTELDGKPLTKETLPAVGWYGDMEFFPHLMRFLQHKSVSITLVFHEPVKGKDFESRKALASYCQQIIGAEMDKIWRSQFS